MARIRPQKPAEAKKKPRVKDDKYLKFIRSLPCLICMREGVTEAAHIRFADASYGKGEPGLGKKPDDWWTLPLCVFCHGHQHKHNERDWWYVIQRLDPLPICLSLYGCYSAKNRRSAVFIVKTQGGRYVSRPERDNPETRKED